MPHLSTRPNASFPHKLQTPTSSKISRPLLLICAWLLVSLSKSQVLWINPSNQNNVQYTYNVESKQNENKLGYLNFSQGKFLYFKNEKCIEYHPPQPTMISFNWSDFMKVMILVPGRQALTWFLDSAHKDDKPQVTQSVLMDLHEDDLETYPIQLFVNNSNGEVFVENEQRKTKAMAKAYQLIEQNVDFENWNNLPVHDLTIPSPMPGDAVYYNHLPFFFHEQSNKQFGDFIKTLPGFLDDGQLDQIVKQGFDVVVSTKILLRFFRTALFKELEMMTTDWFRKDNREVLRYNFILQTVGLKIHAKLNQLIEDPDVGPLVKSFEPELKKLGLDMARKYFTEDPFKFLEDFFHAGYDPEKTIDDMLDLRRKWRKQGYKIYLVTDTTQTKFRRLYSDPQIFSVSPTSSYSQSLLEQNVETVKLIKSNIVTLLQNQKIRDLYQEIAQTMQTQFEEFLQEKQKQFPDGASLDLTAKYFKQQQKDLADSPPQYLEGFKIWENLPLFHPQYSAEMYDKTIEELEKLNDADLAQDILKNDYLPFIVEQYETRLIKDITQFEQLKQLGLDFGSDDPEVVKRSIQDFFRFSIWLGKFNLESGAYDAFNHASTHSEMTIFAMKNDRRVLI